MASKVPEKPIIFIVGGNPRSTDRLSGLLISVGSDVKSIPSLKEFNNIGPGKRPGCLLLHINKPGVKELAFQSRLAKSHSWLQVIYISSTDDVALAVSAMKAGASDYCLTNVRKQRLVDTVRLAISESRKQLADHELCEGIRGRLNCLTRREHQILDCVVSGMTAHEAAIKLGTATRTAELHRSNLMKKMEAANLPDLLSMMNSIQPFSI